MYIGTNFREIWIEMQNPSEQNLFSSGLEKKNKYNIMIFRNSFGIFSA